jgi:hypothetical protein
MVNAARSCKCGPEVGFGEVRSLSGSWLGSESLNGVIMRSERVFERRIYAVLTLVLRIIAHST